jgi:hypothetical protein
MPGGLDTLGDGLMFPVHAKLAPLALFQEAVDEDLHPVQGIAARSSLRFVAITVGRASIMG